MTVRYALVNHYMMRDILVLQRILGHSSINMTMRYAHLSPLVQSGHVAV